LVGLENLGEVLRGFVVMGNVKVERIPPEDDDHGFGEDDGLNAFTAPPDSRGRGICVRIWVSRKFKLELQEVIRQSIDKYRPAERTISAYCRRVLVEHVEQVKAEKLAKKRRYHRNQYERIEQ
jgi:hypothetical protein